MTKQITASEIAALVNGKVVGNPERSVTGVASIRTASCDQASFISNRKYRQQLESSKAGIVLVCPELADEPLCERTFVVCENVDYCFSKVIAVFAPAPPAVAPGVHPSAVVDPSVKLGANVSVGANAVIEAGAVIGDGTVIGACSYIGHEVKIGAMSMIYPNVTVMYRCVLGNKVVVHPGVVIGGDGFGFVPGPQGLVKVPQTGIVQIDDDVEIGSNTTIDRARFGKTWIKSNVKVDNLVMIAHNVTIGESSILVAQCGIAGSAELGRGVVLAAKSGVNGHITLGDGVQVAGTSGVVKSLPAGAIALGTPAEGQREFMARMALPKKVEKLTAKLEALQNELNELKNSQK